MNSLDFKKNSVFSKQELSVGVFQLNSIDDLEFNVSQIKKLVMNLPADQKFDLLCFPENCLYMRLIEGEKIRGIELSNPLFRIFAELCEQFNLFIHFGSVALLVDGQLFNSSVLITPCGEVLPSYQKLHLFDIHLENRPPFKESDIFSHGQSPRIFEINGWKIGQSICYDVRFAELYSQYAQEEVDLILVPAAFLVETGLAHWEVLLRARAIESQCYFVASAQAGIHKNPNSGCLRETYGHSMVVDPWGSVMTCSEKNIGLMSVKLNKAMIEKVRRQIPMRNHRRLNRDKNKT